ncbi:MAG: MBL fold metallo-hydrolase [Candidatus Kariarchaeaceae archaeon]
MWFCLVHVVLVHFLGTGNAFGHEGRLHSCYVISGSKTILLDAGFATFPALRKYHYKIEKFSGFIISHLHPDHYMFLPQLALEDFYILKLGKSIPVYGPLGLREKIFEVTKLLYNDDIADHIPTLYDFYEHQPGESFTLSSTQIRTLPAAHSPEARMIIIELDGKSIGYTGDTALLVDSFSELLKCDITITEATTYSHKIPDHTTVKELIDLQIPSEKRVYLSHVGNSVIENKDKIKPPLYLANDGMEVEV